MVENLDRIEEAPTARRRRRYLWFFVLAAAGIVTALVLLSRYQPLSIRVRFIPPTWQPAGEDMHHAQYEHAAVATLPIVIRNEGPWGVRLLEIPTSPSEPFFLWRVEGGKLPLNPHDDRSASRPLRTNAPASIEAGSEAYVDVIGRFDDCRWYMPGGSQVRHGFEVRYEFLWFERVVELDLGHGFGVVSPPAGRCPTPGDLGAVPLTEAVQGTLVHFDNWMACILEGAGVKRTCHEIPEGQYSYSFGVLTRDEAVADRILVMIEPDEQGRIQSIERIYRK